MLTAFDARDEWLRTAERIRLHSLSMLVLARVFAVLLAASMVRVVQEQAGALARVGVVRAVGEGVLHVLLLAVPFGCCGFATKSSPLAPGSRWRKASSDD